MKRHEISIATRKNVGQSAPCDGMPDEPPESECASEELDPDDSPACTISGGAPRVRQGRCWPKGQTPHWAKCTGDLAPATSTWKRKQKIRKDEEEDGRDK